MLSLQAVVLSDRQVAASDEPGKKRLEDVAMGARGGVVEAWPQLSYMLYFS